MLLVVGIVGAEIFEADSIDSVPEDISVDVVLLDVRLPGLSGIDGISFLKKKWPQTHILMLTASDSPETMQLALGRGADGFVSKVEEPEKIIDAIQILLSGKTVEKPINQISQENVTQVNLLTQRQREVLELLHQGLSNKLIARKLALSEHTVRRHVQDVLKYFGVVSRSEAVFAARHQGLVD